MYKTIVNPLIKDEVTFKQTAVATNGRITSLIVTLMPGGGTPMHYHRRFTETFIVVEGELIITLRNKTIRLLEGQEFTVEKNVAHRFENRSDKAVVFSTVILPGSTGFENALCILYGLARDKRTNSKGIPLNILELAAISDMSDMHQAGAAAMLSPVVKVCAVVARLTNVHKRLIRNYCS